MMSESMIERVALVVARKRIGSREAVPPMVVGTWDRNTARAILEAMREPTDAMIDAGVSADYGKTLGDRVANCHRSMIDAALTPSPASK